MICGRPDKVQAYDIVYLLKNQEEFGLTYGQMVRWLSLRGVSISKPGLIKAINRYQVAIDSKVNS